VQQQEHAKILAGPFKGRTIKITMRLCNLVAPGVVSVDTDQEVTGYTSLPPGIVPTSAGVSSSPTLNMLPPCKRTAPGNLSVGKTHRSFPTSHE
jgi:hypothetical protein